MRNIISKYIFIFKDYIEGSFVKQSTDVLLGGSRISYIFHNTLYNALDRLHRLKTLTNYNIWTWIKNITALWQSLFSEEKGFDIFMRQQILRM